MKNIKTNISELIGNTPIVELKNIEKKYGLKSKIFAKVEYFNPTGSVKDRASLQMINEAVLKGQIKEGATIIEPTSGNTGIGLASICASKGFKAIIVMPETMSIERRKLIQAYGAKIVLTEGKKGMAGAVEKAKELHEEIPNSFIPSQFDNLDNAKAHYLSTGPEIYNDMDKHIDYFVAGIGTGGTITGTGKYLKEQNKNIKVIGVEPASSPLLTKGYAGGHAIQGIGANFIPSILNREVIDEVVAISNEDAIKYAKEVGFNEGFLVGISAGASLKASIDIALKETNKNIVVIFPDSGDRYLSTPLFDFE